MNLLADYRSLRKAGQLQESVELLRRKLPELDSGAIAQAGKLLQKDLPAAHPGAKLVEVLILGQCTTSYLPPVLTAWAWHEGVQVSVRDGSYDQVIQDLMQLQSAPDIIVLLPWHQRLFAGDDRSSVDRLEDEMTFLQQAWAQIARLKSKLIQVSYDWMGTGALGYGLSTRVDGRISLIQQANASLRASLPPGSFLVDLETISAWHGKSTFYDERNYHWLKQPFSPDGLSVLARHIATGVRVLGSGRRKVLVLDLDNTLWGGVVGELGHSGIAVAGTPEGEAFLAFQKHVKQLKASGVLLAVCSKNNHADAFEPFDKNDQMALKFGDFAAFHATWDTKPARLRLMAEELNLGLDSFVFFDDNPAEREHVRAELPQVTVVEVPLEPAHYVRALQESLAFETVDITTADTERAEQYATEASRRQAQTLAATPGEYLASLQMTAGLHLIDQGNLDRVVDLITKTNQFNLTTRRHSRVMVEDMAAADGGVCFAVTLRDRFGDYGLVSVILARRVDAGTLELDTWLMSCRAMGRTLEHWVLNRLVSLSLASGCHILRAVYLPTPKNIPVKTLLPDMGFQPVGDDMEYKLDLTSWVALSSQVSPIGPE